MSNQKNNLDAADTGSLSDSAIRRSLLGSADPVDQAKFETLVMLDDQFERRVYRLELELADDFSFGQLSAEERTLFTSRFLVTRDRVRELAVSQALRKAISSNPASQVKPLSQRYLGFFKLFAFDRPFGSALLAFVALLIFGSLLWLSQKAPPVRRPAISRRQPAPSPEQRFAHPVVSPTPSDNATDDRGSSQQQVPTITLQLEGSSESRQILQLPKGEVVSVRLELLIAVDSSADAAYRADLVSADGVKVTNFIGLKVRPGSPPRLVIDVPAQLMQSGVYTVELRQTSAGGNELVRYGFEVKQE